MNFFSAVRLLCFLLFREVCKSHFLEIDPFDRIFLVVLPFHTTSICVFIVWYSLLEDFGIVRYLT